MEEVYCTLILTDGYLPGAQVLAHSLRDGGATRKLAVLVTQDYLSDATMTELRRLYDYVIPVERITNRSHGQLVTMDRLDLSSAFTKIHLWRMTQFSKIVYLDADVVALRAPEELFAVNDRFAASPDIGWPDCFNSGVMVLKPDMGTFHGLRNLAQRGISFDGADQGLLNEYFREWHRLSFVYNVTPSGHYQYAPAYNHYRSNITMAHFIGPGKPWVIGREVGQENPSTPYGELLGRWWATWDTHYRPLTEQDPALAWVTPKKTFDAPPPTIADIQRPNLMPTEYDPNFRREHTSFDAQPTQQPAPWAPPATLEEQASRPPPSHSEPEKPQYQAPQFNPHQFQPPVPQYHHNEAPSQPPPPPVFLPKEHVPYVPREMPYTAYSQTQGAPTYHHHEARHYQAPHEEHHHHQPAPPPPPQQHHHHHQPHHVYAPQPVHQQWQEQGRRFSQEIPDRLENSLPLPPMPSIPETHHQPDPPAPEVKPFEAPMQEWNAERFSPPPHSRPEASNWPTQVYSNEWDQEQQDTTLFVPPVLSAPPNNLHYELPPKVVAPPKPAPLFPWEQRDVPRPSRVFAGDEPAAEEVTTEEEEVEEQVDEEFETEEASSGYVSGGMSGWDTYSRGNAWDSIPSIERYVASFQKSQRKTVRTGDITPNPHWRSADQNAREDEDEEITSARVLPPEISVTPTPFKSMRGYRSSAMDDESKFPSAKGIPDQQSWDPFRKLQELRDAPREMLNKRSPPSPEDLPVGSPHSPASILVSSSMPVPEKDFHITAYQRRHERSLSSANSSITSSPQLFRPEAEKPEPWRPIPRRYASNSTQTEMVETSDAETQSDPEDIDAAMEELPVSDMV